MEIAQIIRTRRKTVALIIQRDGSLLVRAPIGFSDRMIMELVRKKEKWIRGKQEQARIARPTPKLFAEGEEFLYLGRLYRLAIVERQRPALRLGEQFTLARAALPKARGAFKAWYARQAKQVITARAELLAARHGFAHTRIKITSARTRWGSCGRNGSLNFSWRLVMAPPDVIDYVVIHELVHIKVRNHSRVFWNQVAQILPDYQERKGWLKQHGSHLEW